MGVHELSLPTDIKQEIVTGILKGYKDYLGVRQDAQQRLRVSAAYAWVRGNHVDSAVDVEVEGDEGVDSSVKKAGYTWEYIQFQYNPEDADSRALIIIKAANNLNKAFKLDAKAKNNNSDNYLYRLSTINDSLASHGALDGKEKGSIQLDLFNREEQDLSETEISGFDRFYVVTYEVDAESKMISNVSLTMPNAQNMTITLIEDLTDMIANSGVEISDEDVRVIKNERIPEAQFSDSDNTFGFTIGSEENQEG
jgi:hypothetical protein